MKGKKGCNSRHIDDRVLYQAFIDVFNTLVENNDYFMGKWQERLETENVLVRYKAKQFMEMIEVAETMKEFDTDRYFALVEKMTVYDGGKVIVNILDRIIFELNVMIT